jgi:hypothetical protein
MKLAEALILRADAQKRLQKLLERVKSSVLVQEGEAPPEDPAELLAEAERLVGQIRDLMALVNRTNLTTRLADGRSLTDALAERDALDLRHAFLTATAEAAVPKMDRMGRMEIKKIPTVNVADLRRRVDETARARRELDTTIQAVNWSTDLIEE